jgi:hypothetical protein
MKLIRYIAAGILAAGTALALGQPASATPEGAVPIEAECAAGWYVNPDEANRAPEPTEDGFLFAASDLMHRQVDLPLADLEPGSYEASPAPDQPSFFSVEVRSASGAYGTLRWNPATAKWSITIGAGGAATAGQFEDASPVALLAGKVTKWGPFDPETNRVISFGVGYTLNPPGMVDTLVTEVSFGGTDYSLACEPEETASPSPTAAPTKAPTTRPASAAPTGTPATLPVTGSGGGLNPLAILLPMGAALVLGGVGFVLMRRRRDNPTFTAE